MCEKNTRIENSKKDRNGASSVKLEIGKKKTARSRAWQWHAYRRFLFVGI
jgi:hypothetical protein